jgi:DNA-binding beta-propeller fold protein YncE
MHELPQLGKLERKYPNELAVIGVQSPKYLAEADVENLKAAVERYDIEHPVVNDPEFRIWDSYAVKAWPTLVFISPDGKVIGQHAGEATFEALDRVMTETIAAYEEAGTLERGPLSVQPERCSRPLSRLSFPGKVLPLPDGVAIADSGHHRIIICSPAGEVLRIAGSGEQGADDGAAESARFNRPQGMAFDGNTTLYVADEENHSIRSIDRETGAVNTVAGTGSQATQRVRRGPSREVALSSPWDLAYEDGKLYIAMAGLHQVWLLDLKSAVISVWAGTGHEGIRDGPREQAWLAQPMGLAVSGGFLYVACAESQAIRRIDLASDVVTTLVGRGLFDFGDKDGSATEATLQHCQDVAVLGDGIYVADTYNNKIKAIDPSGSTVQTVIGSGERGELDGPGAFARMSEPAGLAARDRTLWIADTNNHLIRTADVDSLHIRAFALHGMGLDVAGI